MTDTLSSESENDSSLSRRVAEGDAEALETLLIRNRPQLRKMVHLRISPKLQARLDESDVVQEAMMQAALAIGSYKHVPNQPFYLWLRRFAENKLNEAYRRHLGAQKRDASNEVEFSADVRAPVNSISLARHFLSSGNISPSSIAMRFELQQKVQAALEELEDIDREVLVLKHFEQLSIAEIAQVLNLSKSGASHRYLNALARFRTIATKIPGLLNAFE